MAPTSATEGLGHRNRENRNVVSPRIHGRRILFEDHHCQDNNDAYEISVVERSQHYCGFYHNKSLLYLWNIIYDMGKCSPP